MSIFEQIGGPPAMTAAVDDFYRRVMADPALSPYFDGVDMRRLKNHQRAFISAAIGAPDPYLGRSMPDHFDRVVHHLVNTLADLGVADSIIDAVGATLAPLKADIAGDAAARAS